MTKAKPMPARPSYEELVEALEQFVLPSTGGTDFGSDLPDDHPVTIHIRNSTYYHCMMADLRRASVLYAKAREAQP